MPKGTVWSRPNTQNGALTKEWAGGRENLKVAEEKALNTKTRRRESLLALKKPDYRGHQLEKQQETAKKVFRQPKDSARLEDGSPKISKKRRGDQLWSKPERSYVKKKSRSDDMPLGQNGSQEP